MLLVYAMHYAMSKHAVFGSKVIPPFHSTVPFHRSIPPFHSSDYRRPADTPLGRADVNNSVGVTCHYQGQEDLDNSHGKITTDVPRLCKLVGANFPYAVYAISLHAHTAAFYRYTYDPTEMLVTQEVSEVSWVGVS